MVELYYHFDATQQDAAALVQEQAEKWGAACEVERDEDGTGMLIRPNGQFRAAMLLLTGIRPTWEKSREGHQ